MCVTKLGLEEPCNYDVHVGVCVVLHSSPRVCCCALVGRSTPSCHSKRNPVCAEFTECSSGA